LKFETEKRKFESRPGIFSLSPFDLEKSRFSPIVNMAWFVGPLYANVEQVKVWFGETLYNASSLNIMI
jgi:hypothetical protein